MFLSFKNSEEYNRDVRKIQIKNIYLVKTSLKTSKIGLVLDEKNIKKSRKIRKTFKSMYKHVLNSLHDK
jgi:hypothetical protein